jgi:hypothetical protein
VQWNLNTIMKDSGRVLGQVVFVFSQLKGWLFYVDVQITQSKPVPLSRMHGYTPNPNISMALASSAEPHS